MSISVQHLQKNYGEQKAVNDLSFSIGKGEIVGFLGPNGAGKSTTMKMITGYLTADHGQALVAGIDVLKDPIAAKRTIGYLPEANPLYYDMYVREYLYFIAGVHKIRNREQRIDEVIEMTGLTPERKKRTGQLSKGYKQRVGLAAALIYDPEVLILDEPTSGLDPNQIVDIRNLIKQQGANKTVLFSSHILQEVEAICDRVIIINKGQIVADDRLTDLRKKGDQTILKVVFKEPLEQEWLSRLDQITHAVKIDAMTWQLQTKNSTAARKQLMQMALDNDLNIVSLQDETADLEQIFRTLTKDKK